MTPSAAALRWKRKNYPNSRNLSHVPQSHLDPGQDGHHTVELRFLT